MSRRLSVIKGVPALRRGLCFALSLCLVFGALVFAPGGLDVEAEAEANLKYGESFTAGNLALAGVAGLAVGAVVTALASKAVCRKKKETA